jgi:hypothetical protein
LHRSELLKIEEQEEAYFSEKIPLRIPNREIIQIKNNCSVILKNKKLPVFVQVLHYVGMDITAMRASG